MKFPDVSEVTRPFAKESVDKYPGVLVPLAQAKRHETVEAEYARRYSSEGQRPGSLSKKEDSADEKGADAQGNLETGHTRPVWNGQYTIEGLRAEINEDVAASGHDSSYDCEFLT